MKCVSCGASISSSAKFCEYCGSQVVLPKPERRHGEVSFQQIKESDTYQNCTSPARIAKLPKLSPFEKFFGAGFLIVFCSITFFMFVMMNTMGSFTGSAIPNCMSLVPLGMMIFGGFMFWKQLQRVQTMETAKLNTLAAKVVGKRIQVSGGGENSSASTSYFVTFENEEGDRNEYQVWDGSMYGRLSEDDMGVLFLRDRYAVDFDRVAG